MRSKCSGAYAVQPSNAPTGAFDRLRNPKDALTLKKVNCTCRCKLSGAYAVQPKFNMLIGAKVQYICFV